MVGWSATGANTPGVCVEDPADGCGDDRRGDRASTGCGQRRCTQQFGVAVHGGELHACQAGPVATDRTQIARGQVASGGDPEGVVVDQDGHRRQRMVGLVHHEDLAQCGDRADAQRRSHDLDHRPHLAMASSSGRARCRGDEDGRAAHVGMNAWYEPGVTPFAIRSISRSGDALSPAQLCENVCSRHTLAPRRRPQIAGPWGSRPRPDVLVPGAGAGSQGFQRPDRGTLSRWNRTHPTPSCAVAASCTDGRVGPADVVVRGDRIVAVTPHDIADSTTAGHDPGAITDLGDRLVSPGLIDTQINGAGSVDLRQQPAALDALCAIAAGHGVTTVVATLPSHDLDSATIDRLADAADTIARRHDDPTHADTAPIAAVAGIHLEGPYLAPARAGAHRLDDLRPIDADTIAVWAADPRIVMMTLAPELPGALDAITMLAAGGTCVAIGHTDADLDVVAAAVDAGARHVTHLWNAMAGLHHRAPGLPGAVLTDASLTAGLICDGAHVDPLVVRLTWQALGSRRLVLVSDAVVGAGGERHESVLGRGRCGRRGHRRHVAGLADHARPGRPQPHRVHRGPARAMPSPPPRAIPHGCSGAPTSASSLPAPEPTSSCSTTTSSPRT